METFSPWVIFVQLPIFFFSLIFSSHNSQRIDANADATNSTTTTTMTTHYITEQHAQTHTAQTHHATHIILPLQIQAHFIASGTRHAQEYLDNCSLHDANMFTRQGMGQGPRTKTLWASHGRVQGEPTGRAIIVIVVDIVAERRERKRKRDEQREKKRDV